MSSFDAGTKKKKDKGRATVLRSKEKCSIVCRCSPRGKGRDTSLDLFHANLHSTLSRLPELKKKGRGEKRTLIFHLRRKKISFEEGSQTSFPPRHRTKGGKKVGSAAVQYEKEEGGEARAEAASLLVAIRKPRVTSFST